MTPGFLLPFGHRPSLLGSSCSRPGTGPSSRSADRAPKVRTRTGFPRSAPSRYDRSGCLLDPGTAVLSWPDAVPGQRLPLPSGQSLSPRNLLPSRGYSITGHQRRFTRFTRPACPSPVTPGWDQDLRAFPCAPPPPLPATHDRAGPGMSTRPELRCRHNRPSNPRVPSQGATSCRNGRWASSRSDGSCIAWMSSLDGSMRVGADHIAESGEISFRSREAGSVQVNVP